MINVTIYGKEDCCLCHEAAKIIRKVSKDFPLRITEIDITVNPKTFELYKDEIPIITIQGKRAFRYKVHETTLRKKLEKIKLLS